MYTIDLNCDFGENFGRYELGEQQELLKYVSSVNIACGFHAADPTTIRKAVQLAAAYDVNIGAHPGFPDLVGFGRREMSLSPQEVYDIVVYQMGALSAFLVPLGKKLSHVKPHGALYNQSARIPAIAEAIARAVYDFDPELKLMALANSASVVAAKQMGLTVMEEAFVDRTYQSSGQLTPRSAANSLIVTAEEAIAQALSIIKDGQVIATDKSIVELKADTLCLHGDGEFAGSFAKELATVCQREGIEIRS